MFPSDDQRRTQLVSASYAGFCRVPRAELLRRSKLRREGQARARGPPTPSLSFEFRTSEPGPTFCLQLSNGAHPCPPKSSPSLVLAPQCAHQLRPTARTATPIHTKSAARNIRPHAVRTAAARRDPSLKVSSQASKRSPEKMAGNPIASRFESRSEGKPSASPRPSPSSPWQRSGRGGRLRKSRWVACSQFRATARQSPMRSALVFAT
jgi:hypothetical protein